MKSQIPPIDWQWFRFDELTATQLDAVYRLRQQVFVVEQDCVYLDADGKDAQAIHLLGFLDGDLVATLRFFPQSIDNSERTAIGRVCNSAQVRGMGVGKRLMSEAIAFAESEYPTRAIQLGAQSYLREFYRSFGFEQISEEYLEDDIPHILMLRDALIEKRTG